jgi:predicted transcriptional regulator
MKETISKRSRLELYYYILKSCIFNENHTRGSLNRQLKVPYSLLNECLLYLERLGFLEINYNQRTIKTTLEGQEYVRKFGYLMQQAGETLFLST